ncbi:hypothetical protein T11_1752 [Trichinella zimbabwensis]|uniref:Uncharacterized protein n=1 Tax=Trichinella zimbabwensis TaxID=268475 RepID=A0A0V1DJE6_9BILA|nr:hypothetical protein T11_1752 [Trichinella zimbabwensis]
MLKSAYSPFRVILKSCISRSAFRVIFEGRRVRLE